jgi:dUTP pyrophosphatase
LIIQYAKTHPSAQTPVRANPSDAGLDVFYSPTNKHIKVLIAPSTSRVIPTGLKFEVPHGFMLEVKNRSSVAAKRSLLVGACVVDSGYSGEVFVNLHNVGVESQSIKAGDKIAQLVMVPVLHPRPVETYERELYASAVTISDRGDGALGSTDKQKGKQ